MAEKLLGQNILSGQLFLVSCGLSRHNNPSYAFFSHLFCTLRPNMEWKSSVVGPEPTGNAVNKKNQLMSVEMNQDPRTTCDMVYSSFCRN